MVLKLMMLGDPGSGKTSFIIRFISSFFLEEKDLPPVRRVDFFRKEIDVEAKSVELELREFGPEENFRSLQYSKEASGVIYVCDITNPLSLDHILDGVQIVRKVRGRVPILLIGNKLDLKDDRAFKQSSGRKAAENFDLFDYVELSTKTGENFYNAIFESFWKEVNKPVIYPSDIKYISYPIEFIIHELLIYIEELPSLETSIISLQHLLKRINSEQISTASPILKEMIELIIVAMGQGAVNSFVLEKLLIVLKRVSIVDVYSSRLKPLITCELTSLTNLEVDKRGYNDTKDHSLYFLMNGAKDTPLMDFFFSRFEELFLKMLGELEKMDPIHVDHYLETTFPNFYEVVEDTKLDNALSRFCTELDMKLDKLKNPPYFS